MVVSEEFQFLLSAFRIFPRLSAFTDRHPKFTVGLHPMAKNHAAA